jgi:hypothetical protein
MISVISSQILANKMLNGSSLKTTLLILLLLPWGCSFDDCGDFTRRYVDITGLEGSNVLLLEGGYSIVEDLSPGTEVIYHQYGINLLPRAVFPESLTRAGFSFTPGAYACSPPTPQPSEQISDLAIFSDADYMQAGSNRSISAGDTLNAVFNIYDYYSGRIVGLPDFLMDEDIAASEQGIILQPSAAPGVAQNHRFTVHYRLSNGEFYELSLPEVRLLP